MAGHITIAKVSNEVSSAICVLAVGQPLRLCAPQGDSLRLCDNYMVVLAQGIEP